MSLIRWHWYGRDIQVYAGLWNRCKKLKMTKNCVHFDFFFLMWDSFSLWLFFRLLRLSSQRRKSFQFSTIFAWASIHIICACDANNNKKKTAFLCNVCERRKSMIESFERGQNLAWNKNENEKIQYENIWILYETQFHILLVLLLLWERRGEAGVGRIVDGSCWKWNTAKTAIYFPE